MPTYSVTYLIDSEAPDVLSFQTSNDPGAFSPMRAAIVGGEADRIRALHVERVDVRTCRVCGCTDEEACEGGCVWVEPDLCSACLRSVEQ